jgi:hypothetical protein
MGSSSSDSPSPYDPFNGPHTTQAAESYKATLVVDGATLRLIRIDYA